MYVPVVLVVTVHVYVETFATDVAGAVVGQETPETPVIFQLPFPVGDAPPLGPLTVAVTVIVDPRVGLALAERLIEGVALETVMIFEAALEVEDK